MESNLGYLEYEMCSLLSVTPKQLGVLREENPLGLAYLERSFIYRRQQEYEANKKQQDEMKRKSRRKRPLGR